MNRSTPAAEARAAWAADSAKGGAFCGNPAVPGANSLGTAQSSGEAGGSMKGPPLGTGKPDREEVGGEASGIDLSGLLRISLLSRSHARV